MKTSLHIDMRKIVASSGKIFDRRNPISGDVVRTGAAATLADAGKAAESAAVAFKAREGTGPTERRKALLNDEFTKLTWLTIEPPKQQCPF